MGLWVGAIVMVDYNRNRVTSSGIFEDTTLLETQRSLKPNLSQVHTMGSLCSYIRKELAEKLGDRAMLAMLIGHARSQKPYNH